MMTSYPTHVICDSWCGHHFGHPTPQRLGPVQPKGQTASESLACHSV